MKDYQDAIIEDLKENLYFNSFKKEFDQFFINFIKDQNYIYSVCNFDEIIEEIKEDYLLRILKLK